MEKKSVWKTMSKPHRYMIEDIFISYFAMGVYLILIGSALPFIKEEYNISYQVGGLMMSAQHIGYLVVGVLVNVIAGKLGSKAAYLTLGFSAFVGLGLMMLTGNPIVLLVAMLLTGVGKGSTGSFGNQITSNISGGNAMMLNLIQALFAVGACAAPVIAMLCGSSWRMAFAITIGIGVIVLIFGLRIHIGQKEYTILGSGEKADWGFLRLKLFWLCALLLMCYLAVEGAFMGWMVTYFVDSGAASETIAQLLATLLWAAVLLGRLLSAWLSTRFKPHYMVLVMTIGVTVSFTLMMFGYSIVPMVIGTIGMGLFMAGMYGTTLGGSENLVGRYPLCMGMFIALPGIGAAVTPSVIGVLADYFGIRGGMLFTYVLIAILIIVSIEFVRYHEKK